MFYINSTSLSLWLQAPTLLEWPFRNSPVDLVVLIGTVWVAVACVSIVAAVEAWGVSVLATDATCSSPMTMSSLLALERPKWSEGDPSGPPWEVLVPMETTCLQQGEQRIGRQWRRSIVGDGHFFDMPMSIQSPVGQCREFFRKNMPDVCIGEGVGLPQRLWDLCRRICGSCQALPNYGLNINSLMDPKSLSLSTKAALGFWLAR